MKFSIIIPVYDRPDEVNELAGSLVAQTDRDFEVIVVEDGSALPCRDVVEKYATALDIRYFFKRNEGPGAARNAGAEKAAGEYLVFLDSDCVVPPDYIEKIKSELEKCRCDAFGGPDKASETFSDIQKAISFSMTSFLTTGGIRGGKKKLDKFFPRSFNMGVRADLFRKLGGFGRMRYGEDIDLSIRIFDSGASCRLFPDAWVWHKRRTTFSSFFKQVHHSGEARIELERLHPGSLKLVHTLPALFTVSCITIIIPIIYAILIFLTSSLVNGSVKIGMLSVPAAFVQLTGYGTGFIGAWVKSIIN